VPDGQNEGEAGTQRLEEAVRCLPRGAGGAPQLEV